MLLANWPTSYGKLNPELNSSNLSTVVLTFPVHDGVANELAANTADQLLRDGRTGISSLSLSCLRKTGRHKKWVVRNLEQL
jgi:hypothetical protein